MRSTGRGIKWVRSGGLVGVPIRCRRLTMRLITAIATFAVLVGLSIVSIDAAPLLPANAGPDTLRTTPPIELVADGCGYGYRRTRWQDQWGHWHWGRCVPK